MSVCADEHQHRPSDWLLIKGTLKLINRGRREAPLWKTSQGVRPARLAIGSTCAESMMTTSTCSAASAATRALSDSRVPTAAPQSNCRRDSRHLRSTHDSGGLHRMSGAGTKPRTTRNTHSPPTCPNPPALTSCLRSSWGSLGSAIAARVVRHEAQEDAQTTPREEAMRDLEEIRAGDEGDEVAFLVYDGQLALLGALHELVGLRQRAPLLGHDHVPRHDLRHRQVVVAHKVNVAGADDPEQGAADAACVRDGDSREAPALLDRPDVLHLSPTISLPSSGHEHDVVQCMVDDRAVGAHNEGVCNEAIFVALDRPNHRHLLLCPTRCRIRQASGRLEAGPCRHQFERDFDFTRGSDNLYFSEMIQPGDYRQRKNILVRAGRA